MGIYLHASIATHAKTRCKSPSIYAMTPHKKWLAPSLAFPFFGGIMVTTAAVMFGFLDWSFEATRLVYTAMAVGLLIYRVIYYAHKGWLMYFIDLCYMATYGVLASLWLCSQSGAECSTEWQMALFAVAQGAVGGATFPLQTPLALHHPEAFESFFLHVTPMWVTYAIRWRFVTVSILPSVFEMATNAFWRFYVPWVVPYLTVLLVQPFLHDCIAGMETLPDCQLRPGLSHADRIKLKREQYAQTSKENMMAVGAHAVLSFSGFVAAGMAFQYHNVQIAWMGCVLLTCVDAGEQFYIACSDPGAPGNTIKMGFVKMGLAWMVISLVYAHCVWSESST